MLRQRADESRIWSNEKRLRRATWVSVPPEFLGADTVYPEGFRILLDQLGVDPEKEGEVYEGLIEGPLVGCGGWFYLAGELVEAGERMTDAGIAFQCFFRRSHKPTTLADFGDEVFALEFSTRLPWVVSEEPEWPVKTDG